MPDSDRNRKIPVSVIIFTLNEEIHLPACLKSLEDFSDIIVVDSFSSDRTQDISRSFHARFFQNRFEGFGTQRNWALGATAPVHQWVLVLDADERVTPELSAEIRNFVASAPSEVGAASLKRRFYFWGKWLKHSSLYPSWVVRLIRKDRVCYVNRGHAETQEVQGTVHQLSSDLIDENLKGIDDWFERQNRYSTKEAEYELKCEEEPLFLKGLVSGDPLVRRKTLKRLASRLPGRPVAYFIYAYFLRGGFLDGYEGFLFCMMKAYYQWMIHIKKICMKIDSRKLK